MLCKIRVGIFFLCFSALAFLLVACGSGSSNSGAGNNPSTSSNNPPSQPGSSGSPGGSGGTSSGGGSSSGGSSGGGTTSASTGGQFVYVGDTDKLQINGFKVNSDGTLSPVPGSPFQMSGQGEPFQFAGTTLAAVGQFLYTDATLEAAGSLDSRSIPQRVAFRRSTQTPALPEVGSC